MAASMASSGLSAYCLLPTAYCPLKLEHLQPIISGVHGDHAIVAVHHDGPGVCQLSRLAAGGAPGAQTAARGLVDALDAVIAELADDQVALGVFVESVR